jgi:hypothetical protein
MITGFDYDLSYDMYVWYHTKINAHAITEHYKPDDGVMGTVKAIRPDPINPYLWSVDVDYTAVDLPDLFELHPISTAVDNQLILLGFSVFPKGVSLCQSLTTSYEC